MNKDRLAGKSDILIHEFNSGFRPSAEEIRQVAALYIDVFGGEPWYEVNKCGSCEHFFGNETKIGSECSNCSEGLLVPAYNLEEVENMISGVFEIPQSSMYLGKEDKKIVSFMWGYRKSLQDHLVKFGELGQKEESILREVTPSSDFYDLAEIGINRDRRGIGLGKTLFSKAIIDANRLGLPLSVWTRFDTVLTPICLKNGFTQTFGPEVGMTNGRVALTGHTIVGTYSKSPERVFFVKP